MTALSKEQYETGTSGTLKKGKEKKAEAPPKKTPVFFIDEAHKL